MMLRSAAHFMASTGVKIISGLIVIKLMASELGPDGFGLLGQFMTFVAMITMLAGGGITNGVIRSLAGNQSSTPEGQSWLSAAFTLTTGISIAVGVACVALAKMLSGILLKDDYAYLFISLALVQAVVAYGNLVVAEASSRGDSALYAKINIIGTVLATCALAGLVRHFGFQGAAFGLVLMPALPGMIALHHALWHRRNMLNNWRWKADCHRIQQLLSFSAATVVGATSIPVAHLVIRESLGSDLGWSVVGHWQGLVKISDVYMQFVGVFLINYAMPRFAAAIDCGRALRELVKAWAFLFFGGVIGLAVIYMLRDLIIRLVFSETFLPMSPLFSAQLAGDILRTTAASISFFFMGRGHVLFSIAYEFLQGPILILFFLFFQDSAGAHAPVYAHFASNAILAVTMVFILLIWFRGSAR